MKVCLPVLSMALFPSAVMAALAPQYQRAAELVRIVQNSAVQEALQDPPITGITMMGPDRFDVTSKDCRVTVTLFDLPSPRDGWVGPRQFDLTVGRANCG